MNVGNKLEDIGNVEEIVMEGEGHNGWNKFGGSGRLADTIW
ncbi:MAG: hypothetical protein ACRCTE_07150 [Cellulosilyticaceae bacterium]